MGCTQRRHVLTRDTSGSGEIFRVCAGLKSWSIPAFSGGVSGVIWPAHVRCPVRELNLDASCARSEEFPSPRVIELQGSRAGVVDMRVD